MHAWILLTRVNIMLHSYNDAAESAKVSKKLMQSPKYSCDQNTRREVEIMHLEALSRSSESSHWEKAVELYEKVSNELNFGALQIQHAIKLMLRILGVDNVFYITFCACPSYRPLKLGEFRYNVGYFQILSWG